MKNTLIAACLSLATLPAMAEEETTYYDVCLALGYLANQVMEARQIGVPVDQALGVLNEEDEVLLGIMQEIVLNAYQVPRFSGEDYQQRAITEYKNEVIVTCLTNSPRPGK